MDYFQSHTRKHPLKCYKKRLTQDQVSLLETSFKFSDKLDPDRKTQLAQQLDIPARQVAIWYQNKRARCKNQSLEVDHKALQLRLEHALADNARLEREVERLKRELDKAQEMLMPLNNTPYNYSSLLRLSSSCDEVRSSDLFGESKYFLEKEFYACLVDDEGQFER